MAASKKASNESTDSLADMYIDETAALSLADDAKDGTAPVGNRERKGSAKDIEWSKESDYF